MTYECEAGQSILAELEIVGAFFCCWPKQPKKTPKIRGDSLRQTTVRCAGQVRPCFVVLRRASSCLVVLRRASCSRRALSCSRRALSCSRRAPVVPRRAPVVLHCATCFWRVGLVQKDRACFSDKSRVLPKLAPAGPQLHETFLQQVFPPSQQPHPLKTLRTLAKTRSPRSWYQTPANFCQTDPGLGGCGAVFNKPRIVLQGLRLHNTGRACTKRFTNLADVLQESSSTSYFASLVLSSGLVCLKQPKSYLRRRARASEL